ncbi:MAG: flagellar basal body rod protein FlgB [Lachnospiraceae bacterium]|jgi:flagellar basal-body rod protein FlgB|nr:flagellar basal body rod protein FlgB [Lachnospiraceae bacterium]
MINTSAFDYINVLQKTADAAWIRNDVIANNIANATTPGYKRQDVAFEDELSKALRHSRYKSMDAKVADLKINRLNPRTYTDSANYSYRVDGNNVDIETENVTLAANQLKYNGLVECLNQEFKNLQMVMK